MKPARRKMRDLPSVGIVSDDPDLVARIEVALRSVGYPIVFALSFSALELSEHALREGILVTTIPRVRDSAEIKRLKELFPSARLVACMAPVNLRGLRLAIDSGIDGIVWSSDVERTLDPTIRGILADQLVIPRDSYRSVTTSELTNREKQSLSLVVMGFTNQEIAQRLFLSEATVKSHLNSAYRKLGVHSRGEAIQLITDPAEGLGTGILAITRSGLERATRRSE